MSNNFAPWDSCTMDARGPQPGALALLAWHREADVPPGRSGGIFAPRNVRGGTTRSVHACGRALDWMRPVARSTGRGTASGERLVRLLARHGRRVGIQLIIYNRRIYSARNPEGVYYGGVHPHYDHLHIELTRAAAQNLTLATLRAVLGDHRPKPEKENERMERIDLTGVVANRRATYVRGENVASL